MTGSRTILVTGATGFLGRQALAPLRKLGFEVHAASRRPAKIFPEALQADVRWHVADVLNAGTTRALLEEVRPTCLLHFAWYAEHGKFWTSPANQDWLSATQSLVKAFAETGGRRFVGTGTCAEYAWTDKGGVYGEDFPLRPATAYGAAKASAFTAAAALAAGAGVEFAWGRIFHVFGPHENPARIVPALIRAHLTGGTLDCSQGTQLRDFLPASAVGEAFAQLCAGETQGAVNIGSGRAETLRSLSDRIARLAGRAGAIHFGAFHDAGPEILLPSIERLTGEAGWHPPDDPDTGLRDAIEWWRNR